MALPKVSELAKWSEGVGCYLRTSLHTWLNLPVTSRFTNSDQFQAAGIQRNKRSFGDSVSFPWSRRSRKQNMNCFGFGVPSPHLEVILMNIQIMYIYIYKEHVKNAVFEKGSNVMKPQ